MSDVRLTHIGGPTALIDVGGWRLLTDPTFDPPGRKYRFGWGTGSQKLAGPAIAAADIGPIDAVLLTRDHHDDNLDPAGRALLPLARVVVTTRCAGTARSRACFGSPATPCAMTACARSQAACMSAPRCCTSAACSSRSRDRCATFATAPAEIRDHVRWLPLGADVEVAG